jgi:hypothetical protein
MLIMVTMSFLISANACGWLFYGRAHREPRNIITVIEGIFFVVSLWNYVDLEPRTVASVQERYSVL